MKLEQLCCCTQGSSLATTLLPGQELSTEASDGSVLPGWECLLHFSLQEQPGGTH